MIWTWVQAKQHGAAVLIMASVVQHGTHDELRQVQGFYLELIKSLSWNFRGKDNHAQGKIVVVVTLVVTPYTHNLAHAAYLQLSQKYSYV